MLRLKEAHCTGTLGPELAKLFKEYILVHCERCSDINCRVPHMAAGWLVIHVHDTCTLVIRTNLQCTFIVYPFSLSLSLSLCNTCIHLSICFYLSLSLSHTHTHTHTHTHMQTLPPYSPHPRTVHAGQIHKGIAACMNTESISVTKKPGSDNIARFGSLDVSCKIPSTSGEW